jgi:adenosylcobinamide kinase/adenosylcobinamide-phosphate guanylyltransferase
MIVLVTGPVRAGKSARAAQIARGFGRPVTHIATARVDPTDIEMTERVARHRIDRAGAALVELWQPGGPDLPELIASASADATLLVDSLGTWLAGHILGLEATAEREPLVVATTLERASARLLSGLEATPADVVLVSEETGWGIVPINASARLFRDELGRLARHVGRRAERVELVVAGYAIDLRVTGTTIED